MATIRRMLIGGLVAALAPSALGGCYLYSAEKFQDWPEVRMQRDGGGEMVGHVLRRGQKTWPGDSYEVMIRFPTNLFSLPRQFSPTERDKDAMAFIHKLCGEGRDVYVILKSANDRTNEVYYNLWCKPPKQTS